MTAVLERPGVTGTEEERPVWLATTEDLEACREKPREEEVQTSVYAMRKLAGKGALLRDGKPVRVTPWPSEVEATERTWVKVTAPHAERSSKVEGLPTVMRLWFAAVERCDSNGRADFNSGELADALGCADRTVRDAIAQGKRCGQFREESDARHVHLIGVTNERPSAKRLSKKRRTEDSVHKYATKRPRTS